MIFLGETPLSWGEDQLTNEEKLACESILCLSSGERPDECDPALNYFSALKKEALGHKKRPEIFLKKCPDADADDNMVSLIDVLVDYNCSACTLEQLNARYVEVRLVSSRSKRHSNQSCLYDDTGC